MVLQVNSPNYRPTVLDGGRHLKPQRRSGRFGQPLQSSRWRLISLYDGRLRWSADGKDYDLAPGQWALQPPSQDASPLQVTTGSHWGEVRFAAMPSCEADPDSLTLWGVALPVALGADRVQHLQAAFEDVLSWWWRDEWHQARADTRMAGLLLDLVGNFRLHQSVPVVRNDDFAAADTLWSIRPLAPLTEVAQACHLSERHFRRQFRQARGMSPSAWSRRIMATLAGDMLRSRPDWPIDVIAKHLGYRHHQTFIRAFTAETGYSPAQWRRQRLSQ